MPMNEKIRNCGSATCTALLKTMLFFFNILFFALGGCLVFIGVYGLRDFHSFFTFTSSSSVWATFLCAGLFMLSVAVLSFWCIPKGVRWLLNVYGGLVFILCLVVLGTSTVFMVRREMLEETIKGDFSKKMNIYPTESEPIDFIQRQIECCGLENYTDWFATEWANKHNNVPESCCIDTENCIHENINLMNVSGIWQEGCYMKVKTAIENQYTFIGAIGLGASVFILFGAILSWWLAANLNSSPP